MRAATRAVLDRARASPRRRSSGRQPARSRRTTRGQLDAVRDAVLRRARSCRRSITPWIARSPPCRARTRRPPSRRAARPSARRSASKSFVRSGLPSHDLGPRRDAVGRQRRVEARHVRDRLRVLALPDRQVERRRALRPAARPVLLVEVLRRVRPAAAASRSAGRCPLLSRTPSDTPPASMRARPSLRPSW